jgi:hypothetical protein
MFVNGTGRNEQNLFSTEELQSFHLHDPMCIIRNTQNSSIFYFSLICYLPKTKQLKSILKTYK